MIAEKPPLAVGLSIKEVATILGVSERTVRREISDGHLPCIRIRNRVVVRQADLDEYLRKGMDKRD